MFSGKFGDPEVWVTRLRSVVALSRGMERGGRMPVGAIVDAHNAVGHRFRQNEPGENFCDGTERKVGIAIGRLFAADHLRAEAEDLGPGFCDKAHDEAGRLVERPSGGVHKTRSDPIEDHRYTLIGHHTVAPAGTPV